jgi:hypothetical protein
VYKKKFNVTLKGLFVLKERKRRGEKVEGKKHFPLFGTL